MFFLSFIDFESSPILTLPSKYILPVGALSIIAEENNYTVSIDSILEGVPVITCSEYNFLWPISTHTIEDVENPRKGEREQLLYNLAYAQWSVQEIKEGKPWKHLI